MHNLTQLEGPVNVKRHGRLALVIFEIFIYISLLIWIISYNKFNVQELLLLMLLPVVGALWVVLSGFANKIPAHALNLVATLLFILIFDKIDNTNIAKVIAIPVMERIPIPTALLSTLVFVYIIDMQISGLFVVHINKFGRMFALACIFLFISASLAYPLLYLNYHISFQPNFQLATKMVKYCLIILLFQAYCDSTVIKRYTATAALSVIMIEILNLIL